MCATENSIGSSRSVGINSLTSQPGVRKSRCQPTSLQILVSRAMRGSMEAASPASGLRIGEMLTRMPRTPTALRLDSSLSVVLLSSRSMIPRRTKFAHGIQHAGIVKAIGAGLDEDVTHKAETADDLEIGLKRLIRRLIADVGAVRVTLGRAEHVEMRVAGVRRRCEGRFEAGIRIVLSCFVHGLPVMPLRRIAPEILAPSAP